MLLEVKNLSAKVGGDLILNGLNLSVKAGEVHAIMGPNGSGKSTLSKVLAGHPDYEVTGGEALFEVNRKMKNLLEWEPDERAVNGVFLAFQYPTEVPGLSNKIFLREAFNKVCEAQGSGLLSDADFEKLLREKAKLVKMDSSFLDRALNVDFSGGEKKRNEILQMAVLNPKLAILDETDSGLDIDSLRIVSEGVNSLRSPDKAIVLITHYQRLLDHIVPDFVHILYRGKIIRSGDAELAREIEDRGYDWVIEETR